MTRIFTEVELDVDTIIDEAVEEMSDGELQSLRDHIDKLIIKGGGKPKPGHGEDSLHYVRDELIRGHPQAALAMLDRILFPQRILPASTIKDMPRDAVTGRPLH